MQEPMNEKPKSGGALKLVLIFALVIAAGVILGLKVLPVLFGTDRAAESETAVQPANPAEASDASAVSDVPGSTQQEALVYTPLGEGGTYRLVSWNGKNYEYNDHLTNILLMGIDKTVDDSYDVESRTAGRSDVLQLISIDRLTGHYTQIQIPRNTLTEIEYQDASGNTQGKYEDYICLSFYFGDGKYKSCKLTKQAVSDLFCGIPIENYAALNLDAIQKLAELAGEVPVVVPNDSLSERYPEFQKGETVILTPENTEIFVRSRDISQTMTSFERDERQQAYLNAYKSVAKQKAGQDPHFLTELYEGLKPFMTTNMDNGQFVDMLEAALQDPDSVSATLPGEATHGAAHDDFYPDEEALKELIIQTFYREVEG